MDVESIEKWAKIVRWAIGIAILFAIVKCSGEIISLKNCEKKLIKQYGYTESKAYYYCKVELNIKKCGKANCEGLGSFYWEPEYK